MPTSPKWSARRYVPSIRAAAIIPRLPPPCCLFASLKLAYLACSSFSFCTLSNVLAYSCARKSSGFPSSFDGATLFSLFVLAHRCAYGAMDAVLAVRRVGHVLRVPLRGICVSRVLHCAAAGRAEAITRESNHHRDKIYA